MMPMQSCRKGCKIEKIETLPHCNRAEDISSTYQQIRSRLRDSRGGGRGGGLHDVCRTRHVKGSFAGETYGSTGTRAIPATPYACAAVGGRRPCNPCRK